MKIAKIILICALLSLISGNVFAELPPTEVSLESGLMFNQYAYSDNWTGGENGAVSWTANVNLVTRKWLTEKLRNRNTLKLAFGQTHNQDSQTKNWAKPEKSTDLIDYESLFRLQVGSPFQPYIAGRFESQFLDQSDPSKERAINPMKFTESIGATRVFIEKENEELSARLGFAMREYIDRDVLQDTITLKRETESSYDGGLEMILEYVTPLAKDRLTLNSKLELFQAVFYSESDELAGLPNENYWKTLDLSWENAFTANVTDYLMVNLYTKLLYDKEEDLAGRFKQTLGLGVTLKFI